MSRSWKKCCICGESTLVSQTNCDEDLGFVEIKGKIICPECVGEITEELNSQE